MTWFEAKGKQTSVTNIFLNLGVIWSLAAWITDLMQL